jgi:hypothetical protein
METPAQPTPPSLPDIQAASEKLLNLLSAADAQLSRGIELLVLRVGFYDKLVILNGGTLALSFTAATGLHGHLNPSKPALLPQDLFLAWELLMFSIVGSVICNWLSMSSVTSQSNFITEKVTGLHAAWALLALRAIKPEIQHIAPTPDEKIEAAKQKSARILGSVGAYFGLLSQLATFTSYIFLFRYAKANLLNF